MIISSVIIRSLTEIQKLFEVPLNAIEVKIKENDTKNLKTWKNKER